MMTFLFWNIQKKPLLTRVARLVTRHAADVLILAECEASPTEVLSALNGLGGAMWHQPPSESSKLRLFTRLTDRAIAEVFTDTSGRMTVYEFPTSGDPPLLLAAVHLRSKFGGWKEDSQSSLAQLLSEDLERIEDQRQTHRTVLVGDLNMDPFDPGVIGGFGFHALMTQELAVRRNQRVVQNRRCRRTFFNPMWQFLADRPGKPAGTYYRHEADPINHYWHVLDQVLVRPELSGKLDHVDVLDHDGADSLTTAGGWPDTDKGSDHLPVLFRLNL